MRSSWEERSSLPYSDAQLGKSIPRQIGLDLRQSSRAIPLPQPAVVDELPNFFADFPVPLPAESDEKGYFADAASNNRGNERWIFRRQDSLSEFFNEEDNEGVSCGVSEGQTAASPSTSALAAEERNSVSQDAPRRGRGRPRKLTGHGYPTTEGEKLEDKRKKSAEASKKYRRNQKYRTMEKDHKLKRIEEVAQYLFQELKRFRERCENLESRNSELRCEKEALQRRLQDVQQCRFCMALNMGCAEDNREMSYSRPNSRFSGGFY